MKNLRVLIAGVIGMAMGVAPVFVGPSALAVAMTNSPQSAVVTILGKALPSPKLSPNAITLAPDQAVPANAPIGQSYVLPQVLPPDSSQYLVVHADPGQSIHVSGYSGPVIIVPNSPTIATVVNTNATSSYLDSTTITTSNSFSIPSQAKSHTQVLTAFFTGTSTGNVTVVGGILSSGSKWITDNHVFNYYDPNNANMYQPYQITITNPDGLSSVQYTDPEDVYNQSYGIASPYNVTAPDNGNLTIVLFPTLNQTGLAVSGYNSTTASLGWYSSALTLIAQAASPPADAYPDPNSAVYDEYSGHGSVGSGWSGSGIWDSSGRLLSMTTFYYSGTGNLYGFHGQDIVNFCQEYGIPYSTYTE